MSPIVFLLRSLRSFLSDVFFEWESLAFREIYEDKTEKYRALHTPYHLDKALIALEYTDELRQSIESFKYHGASHLEGQFIPFLKKTWNTFEIPREHVIITSIPMHLFSRITHPLDHGKLLSKKLALELGVPYAPLLTKTRHTKRQATLDRAERMKNIAQAFRCNKIDKKQLSEKIIVIVDDVISTSSTANAAAKALKEAGAKTVYGLFLATGK